MMLCLPTDVHIDRIHMAVGRSFGAAAMKIMFGCPVLRGAYMS